LDAGAIAVEHSADVPAAFNLETRDGFRLVEFDPDVFRGRDVRILVDGQRVAEMPHPKPASPYQEVSFRLGEHRLVAVAALSRGPQPLPAPGLNCDLFSDGLSLSGGRSLAQTRADAPTAGDVYPAAFRLVDTVLYITPAAATPGMFIGLSNALDTLGWSTVAAIGAVLLGALGLAVAISRKIWARIRADETRSVRRRAALGWGVLLGSYGAAFVGGVVVAIAIREWVH
jgi:hypothetical protein